jgi:recombination associated protein RdgC
MWFKNVRAYRLTSPFQLTPEQLDVQLRSGLFEPCGSTQSLALGWAPPLGPETETLVHAAAGRFLICMKREEKLLPATVVREMVTERVEKIEQEEGRKVYRKERLTLKDEITLDCLPRAFTRSSLVHAYIDTRENWIFVDSASAGRAEELLNLLRDNLGSFPLLLPQVNHSPVSTMTNWLVHRNVPEGMSLSGDCEMRELTEEGGVVRCRGVEMPGEEVDVHLQAGRQVVRLGLDWDERLSFTLAEDLCLRRLKFADELVAENEDLADDDPLARIDADFELMASAVTELQNRVMTLFGGEATE